MDQRPARTQLTDSVWFWVALFALTGLLMVWASETRALGRRKQLMGRFYARQISGLSVPNPDVAAGQPLAPEQAMGGRWALAPLYAILFALLAAAIYQLVRNQGRAVPQSAATEPPPGG